MLEGINAQNNLLKRNLNGERKMNSNEDLYIYLLFLFTSRRLKSYSKASLETFENPNGGPKAKNGFPILQLLYISGSLKAFTLYIP